MQGFSGSQRNPFVTLSDSERELVRKYATSSKLRSGELIFQEGDPGKAVYFIKEGRVKIYRNSSLGKVAIVGLRKAGDLIGVCEVLGGMPRRGYAETLGTVELWTLEAKQFLEILNANASLAVKVATALGNRLRETETLMANMVSVEVDRRLARLLLQLVSYDETPDGKGTFHVTPLTHQELATMIGACRQTVTTTLQKFKDEGLLQSKKRAIEIADVERLKVFAELY